MSVSENKNKYINIFYSTFQAWLYIFCSTATTVVTSGNYSTLQQYIEFLFMSKATFLSNLFQCHHF